MIRETHKPESSQEFEIRPMSDELKPEEKSGELRDVAENKEK